MKNKSLSFDLKYVFSLLSPASVFARELLKSSPVLEREPLERELDNVERVKNGFCAERALIRLVDNGISPLKDIRRSMAELASRPLSALEMFELKCFLLTYETASADCERLVKKLGLRGFTFFDPSEALKIIDPKNQRVASFYIGDELCAGIEAIRDEKRRLDKKTDGDGAELAKLRSQLAAKEQRAERETLRRLSNALAPYSSALVSAADQIGRLDLTLEKGRLAAEYGCARPQIVDSGITLVGAVNPRLAARIESFTPIDIVLARGATVVTGANMGGKSVALGVVALCAELVRHGFFPFAQRCELELFDDIIVMFGDMDDDERGLSSFGGEVAALIALTERIETENCLVAIDEIARGTNAIEGEAVACAVTGYLAKRDSVSLITTHYDKVAAYAGAHYQVAGLDSGGVGKRELRMKYGLYRVGPDCPCPRSALAVCRAMGLKKEITDSIDSIISCGKGR